MNVTIVEFPRTPVAAVEHRGAPADEYATSARLIAWRREQRLSGKCHATYGLHYTDPATTPAADHRVDFCVAYAGPVAPNPHGVIAKAIPASRCAMARHHGSRAHNAAAHYLMTKWLPNSGEQAAGLPLIFHYVNVGHDVNEQDMITDVYLPLK